MNVIILSMRRCGVSWIGEVLSQVHKRLYGKELKINYEKDRAKVSRTLLKGFTGVYDVDPKVLLKLGYDKILIVKRDLNAMKKAHAKYHGYLELYENLENMIRIRPCFFEKIELYHKLLYDQEEIKNDPKVLIVSLEDLNSYTYSTFNEIIKFLDFKLNLIQKVKLFLRVLKYDSNMNPFVIATNPIERDWNVFSALLPKGHGLCDRLNYLQKIEENKIKIEI